MRKPKYLSPSSKNRWQSNRTGFYLKYLAETKMTPEPQQIYMGVGSGFDAKVKSEIMTRCLGKPLIAGSAYHFESLFEKQVDHHHRDRSLKISTRIWDSYVTSGAFESLWKDIERSPYAPLMEERVEGMVAGVPLLGLPDLVYFDATTLRRVINDWKIMGSTGVGASPPQGHKIVRDGWEGKHSPQHGKPHKKHVDLCLSYPFAAMSPFAAWGIYPKEWSIGKGYLEDFNIDWADQMSTYAWLLGSKVGSEDFVVRVECAACRHPKEGMKIKWSTHLNRVSSSYQLQLIKVYKKIWQAIEEEHIFEHMTKDQSIARCGVLELQASSPKGVHKALRGMGQDNSNFWMRTE